MIVKEKDEIERYLSDSSNLKGTADNVIIPESEKELIKIIKECNESNTPITFYGSGTGLTGSAVAKSGTIVSTERLNKLEIHKDENYAIVGPGLTYSDLEKELTQIDYFYPPNPTEKSSSLGGNIATNASGSRTFKYGSTRDFIRSIRVIIASGETLDLKRGECLAKNNKLKLNTKEGTEIELDITDIDMPNIKNTTGYYLKNSMDAVDLFIGSEGTLGAIVEAEIRIVKRYDNILGLIIFFDDNNNMLDFVEEVRDESLENHGVDISVVGSIGARLMEYFDERSLNILRAFYEQIPAEAKSAIWIEQEYDKDNEPIILDSWLTKIDENTKLADQTWTALTDSEHKVFTEFRHKLPEQVYENLTANDQRKIGTDTAVDSENFEEYYGWLYEELEKLNIPYLVFGHIGNSHLHANLFYNGEKQYELAIDFYNRFVDKILKLGGTVSAEHGIGKIKKLYLEKMYGEKSISIMKEIKTKLNPNWILGKGNLFD